MPSPYVFPKSFRQAAGDFRETYPSICFISKDKDGNEQNYIYLPMPPGLEISDSMQYDSNFELGQLGLIGKQLIETAQKGGDVKEVFKTAKDEVVSRFKKLNAAAAASIAARELPAASVIGGGRIADVVDFTARQMIAKNTHTRFQGANTRTFGFKFKMVADSQEDSSAIKDIIEIFREAAYPGGNTFIQEYPGTWNINFLDKGQDNIWIPKIFECYLTSFSTVYNGGTNMWHENSAPIEVDVSMSFTETRALNRKDIQKLNGKSVSDETEEIPDTISSAAATIATENAAAQRNASNVGIGGITNAFGLGGRGPFGPGGG